MDGIGEREHILLPLPKLQTEVNLLNILENAESKGYTLTSKGNLGITVSNQNKLLISFLTSGAATIVGAKNEEEALSIYKTFTKEIETTN